MACPILVRNPKPIAAPASSAAAGPEKRFTVAYTWATARTPSTARGTSMLQLEKPKMRPEISMIHSEAGGLSTVMKFDESIDPNSIAFQLLVPAWTAAA
jgi:hypothetical protein